MIPHETSTADGRPLHDPALEVDDERVKKLAEAARRHPEDTGRFLEYRLALKMRAELRREEAAAESGLTAAREAIRSTADRTRRLRKVLRTDLLFLWGGLNAAS